MDYGWLKSTLILVRLYLFNELEAILGQNYLYLPNLKGTIPTHVGQKSVSLGTG